MSAFAVAKGVGMLIGAASTSATAQNILKTVVSPESTLIRKIGVTIGTTIITGMISSQGGVFVADQFDQAKKFSDDLKDKINQEKEN